MTQSEFIAAITLHGSIGFTQFDKQNFIFSQPMKHHSFFLQLAFSGLIDT